ncbi:MAG: peroxiredoxin [Myxococcaceae bacterium]
MTLIPIIALLAAAPLQQGQVVPDFTAKTSAGQTVKLSELVKEKTVVLAFFPRAFTPGCTMQMKAFRDRFAELEKKGATVFGVSMDDAETLARFKKDLNAPFEFLADPDGRITTLLGMRDEGDKTADRGNFVIGEDRKVLAFEAGMRAIDPDDAIAACPLRKSDNKK